MTESSPPKLLIDLTARTDSDRVVVSLQSFLRFAEEVSFGLEELEDRWQSFAAPAAGKNGIRHFLDERA